MSKDKSRDIDNDSTKAPQISRKQRQIVNAKVKGLKNREIANIHYPNAKDENKTGLVSHELKKPNVAKYMEQSKLIALKEAGITWKWIVDGIKEAGDAHKQNNFTGEITPDHTIRLAARKQARELMETKQINEEVKEQLSSISSELDEVQLIRLLKKT